MVSDANPSAVPVAQTGEETHVGQVRGARKANKCVRHFGSWPRKSDKVKKQVGAQYQVPPSGKYESDLVRLQHVTEDDGLFFITNTSYKFIHAL